VLCCIVVVYINDTSHFLPHQKKTISIIKLIYDWWLIILIIIQFNSKLKKIEICVLKIWM
jgi:hypothetical protein